MHGTDEACPVKGLRVVVPPAAVEDAPPNSEPPAQTAGATSSGDTVPVTTGHPLFWQELKSVDFLVSVLNDFGIGYVFDLSPGSGAMAIACV